MNQGLRHNKTDKTDAYNLARIQLQNRHKANKQEAEDYHKLIRTIYALIKNDQLYSYEVAKQNQRRKS